LWHGEKIKKTFWGIDHNGEFGLYQLWFLPFGLKNNHSKFLRVGDWVFVGLAFVKC